MKLYIKIKEKKFKRTINSSSWWCINLGGKLNISQSSSLLIIYTHHQWHIHCQWENCEVEIISVTLLAAVANARQKQITEGLAYWAHSFQSVMVGRPGSRSVRQLLTVHPQPGSQEMNAGAQLTSFHSVQSPTPWNGASHIQGGSSHLS